VNDRDRAELYRAIGEQFARSPELHRELNRMSAGFAQVANAAAAWVEQVDRQTQDAVASLDAKFAQLAKIDAIAALDAKFAQLAEMSRGIVSALDIHMASISIPRVEIFSEPLDQVRTDIEMVPYHLPPTPAPVGGISAPSPQPSIPDRVQRNVDSIITGVIVIIVGNALWCAIVWYAQTGTWEFEELLAYLIQVVLQQLDGPLTPLFPHPRSIATSRFPGSLRTPSVLLAHNTSGRSIPLWRSRTIGPDLWGSGLYTGLGRALWTPPWRGLHFAHPAGVVLCILRSRVCQICT
jgi:hypothetical protein